MTATKSKLESLYLERDVYKKGIESSLKRGIDISTQMKYLDIVEAEINEILKQSQPEKKNEPETVAAAELANPTERAANNALDRVINANPNPVLSIEIDSSGVEDEKYFFTSLAAAQKYHHYRNRLRSKLHYWQHKKNKNEGAKEEMTVMCSFFIAQIASIIQYYCKPMHQDRLFKKKYSLGEKDNDKTYCFDMEKLRKDFDF